MTKRKQTGRRSRYRRRADEQMIKRVAHWEYQQARIRKAKETGVDIAMIQDRLGARASLAIGTKRLREWFDALPDPAKTAARVELLARITKDDDALGAEVVKARKDHKLLELAKRGITIDDPLHPAGRCTCGGGGSCPWCVASNAKIEAAP